MFLNTANYFLGQGLYICCCPAWDTLTDHYPLVSFSSCSPQRGLPWSLYLKQPLTPSLTIPHYQF